MMEVMSIKPNLWPRATCKYMVKIIDKYVFYKITITNSNLIRLVNLSYECYECIFECLLRL